jgi:hypothetical protein
MDNEEKLENSNVLEFASAASKPDTRVLDKELEQTAPICHICKKEGKEDKDSYAYHICRHPKCNKYHCVEHTSNVDIDKCSDCSEPIIVEVKKLSKTTVQEEYDEIRDEILTETETHTAKSIHFSGQHWLSNSIIIGSMSDLKLKESIEYHKAMVRMMEDELINRKIQKSKAHLAAHPFAVKRLSNRIIKDGVVTSVNESSTKKTRVARKPKDAADKVLAAMQSGGIDIAKLMELLQKKVSGK